ncbi:CHAP domain-containing protein, partial [Schumannella luteola]
PAQPGSRRAAREALSSPVQSPGPAPTFTESTPRIPAFTATMPQVAAPFGTFDATPASGDTAGRERGRRSGRSAAAPAVARPSSTHGTRKRLSVAGTMVLVGGLFVSLTLPAYASTETPDVIADVAAKADGQVLALDKAAVDTASVTSDTRDGYDSTSASDLKRLYRDALRQRNIQMYLASGAKELGDDYPWATELSRSQGGGLSPLRYYVRECVDFVAWRLNRDAGSTHAPFKWDWSSLTPGGGSAHSWKSQWDKHGWPTSTTPAAGWVAWFPGANHVAYVNSVLPDGSVLIEEYNWGPEIYGQRIIPASSAIYLSPPPA